MSGVRPHPIGEIIIRIRTALTLALAATFVAAGPATAAASTLKDDVLHAIGGIEKKLVDLAGAMPAETYDWSPMEGVRDTSEVYTHIAAGNYMIAGGLGATMPTDIDVSGLEKDVTAKADVIESLKQSIAHVKKAIAAVPENQLGDSITMFGQDMTKRAAILVILEHMSEHLGQAIAYARSNEVVPPWSK